MDPTDNADGARGPRRRVPAAVAVAVVFAVFAVFAVFFWSAGRAGTAALRPFIPAALRPVIPAEPLAPSVPTGLNIPEIGLRVPGISRLGLTRSGALETPPLAHVDEVGWYEYGPAPGQRGSAVLAGHVDSLTRQAIFYRLHDLRRGATVSVSRADGSTVTFTVDSVVEVPKAHFPTEKVYGDPGYPALRLITCGGRFDRATGHYLSNIIVYAHLTGTTETNAGRTGRATGSHG